MRARLLSILVLLLIPIGAIGADVSEGSAAEQEIRGALTRWVLAANRGDWKEALKVWAPDLVGWYPGEPDTTYQREAENATRATTPRAIYEVDVTEVMVSGPLAVVRDIWTFTTPMPTGKPTVVRLKSFEIWAQQPDGAWKINRWISAPEPAK